MNFSALDRYLDHLIADCGIPFLDVAVHQDGKPIYRRGVGHPDVEGKRTVRGNETIWLFSCTKMATCFAALRLIAEGKLSLSDPVSRYLPSFAHLTVRRPDGSVTPAENVMTVEHLFTMTGGLGYDLATPAIRQALEDGAQSTVEVVSAFAKDPLWFEPGTDYRYSLCHDVLAAIVEIVSGMRFSEYLRKYFFDPLGMSDTGFVPNDEQTARFANYFFYHAGTRSWSEYPCKNRFILAPGYESGGAGLFSTVDDYIKLLSAVACGGVTPEGERLLPAECIPMMQENRLPPRALDHFVTTRLYGYGWGLCGRVHSFPEVGCSRSPKGEFGWDGAAASFGMVDPENRLALMLGTQLTGGNFLYHVVHPEVRNLVYDALRG